MVMEAGQICRSSHVRPSLCSASQDTIWLWRQHTNPHQQDNISDTHRICCHSACQDGWKGTRKKNRIKRRLKLGLCKVFSIQMSRIFILLSGWPAPWSSHRFFLFLFFIRNSPNYRKHRLSKVLEMFPEDLSADSKAISSPSTFFFLQHSCFKHSPALLKNHIVAWKSESCHCWK